MLCYEVLITSHVELNIPPDVLVLALLNDAELDGTEQYRVSPIKVMSRGLGHCRWNDEHAWSKYGRVHTDTALVILYYQQP